MSPRRLVPLRLPALAGWLFADLFLVLFVIGLASLPPKPHPRHHTPHPTPSPTPTVAQVLARKPVDLTIGVPPGSLADRPTRAGAISELIRKVDHALSARKLTGRQAGFVLVFASGPVTGIGQAVQTANLVVRELRDRDPVFAGAGGAGYWQGTGNAISLKIFFFVGS